MEITDLDPCGTARYFPADYADRVPATFRRVTGVGIMQEHFGR
jgi:hypothetical protein